MAVCFQEVLQASRTWLLDHLSDFDEVNDHLYQDKIIKQDDIERISKEITQREKCRKLISIIEFKDDKCYKKFLSAIENTVQDHVVRHLKNKEVTLSVSKVLHEKFESKSSFEVNFKLLEETLSKFVPKHIHTNCTEELIEEALSEDFELCTIKTKANGERIVNHICLKEEQDTHVTEQVALKTGKQVDPNDSAGKLNEDISIDDWDVSDVARWLTIQKLPPEVVQDFSDQAIDGIGLKDLTEDDLKSSELPHVKLGHRKRILAKIKDLVAGNGDKLRKKDDLSCNEGNLNKIPARNTLEGDTVMVDNDNDVTLLKSSECKNKNNIAQQVEVNEESVKNKNDGDITLGKNVSLSSSDTEENSEQRNIKERVSTLTSVCYPRKFDSGFPKPSEKYIKDRQLREANRRPADMIEPMEYYSTADLTATEGLLDFSRQLVKFVCACLNERTNGRLYFGIDEDGTVKGTKVDKEISSYDRMVTNLLSKCFFQDQKDVVLRCVRPPKFVDVIHEEDVPNENLYVCEIDVIPAADCCKDEAFFVKCPKEGDNNLKCIQTEKAALYRCIDGHVVHAEDEELRNFMEIKKGLFELRKYRENKQIKHMEYLAREPTDTAKKLIRLLSLGNEKSMDLYPILVTNKIPTELHGEFIKENLSFIGDIEWKAVFDFDPNAILQSFIENEVGKVTKVVPCVSEFDKSSNDNLKNPERLKTLHEDIVSSSQTHWIFANGYNLTSQFPQLKSVQWTRQKREPFKEAVRFFGNLIPKGRAIIVFLLFSADIEVLIEAMQEFISVFTDQWVLITENEEEIAEPIFGELLRRRCAQEVNELNLRSVIGMPWNHVQETVKQVYGPKRTGVCQLPCSDGSLIYLKEKVKNEMTDLDILSASECENTELTKSPEKLKGFEMEEETDFYKGGEVSWWNFWFKTHVLKRNKYTELAQNVRKTLRGSLPEDSYVGKVSLYHQPGSGATTTAKHVLWGLKKVHRCAIIRNITDATAGQIIKLRCFNDKKPQPVVLLMDNLDEEPTNVLLAELDELAKHAVRSSDNMDPKFPFCVVLICFRRSKLPRNDTQSCRTLLYHELDENEIRWFQKKNEELEKRQNNCDNEMIHAVNPKLLISFNIMRKNFDKKYIERITRNMVKEISDVKERHLLKYVAVLNAFDLRFREIPSASFDNMMVDMLWTPGPRYGRGAELRCWETKLSPEFRVLINETSAMTFKSIKALRITNPLLSKEVLKVLQQIEGATETVSSATLKFFNCKEIFNVSSHAKEELLKIIKDIMKHRGRLPSGQPETKFAPLIQHIIDKESAENAVRVLEKVFDLSGDAYIAQQLARINIFSENWEQATKFAQLATEMKPESSYLWDTYGRVYKTQLAEEYKNMSVVPDKKLDNAEMLPLVKIATRGVEIFRKVQELSEKERHGLPTNNAGYFGELEVIECLLHCLNNTSCFKDKLDLKRCIVEEDYFPEDLKQLLDTEEGSVLHKLKLISVNTEKAMNKLEDERMQLRDEMIDEYRVNSIIQRNRKMEEVQANLDFYLGEDSDNLPPEMDPHSEEACRRRRRRISTLGGNSLRRVFNLKIHLGGEQTLKRICKLCTENINSERGSAIDYQTVIAASLALAAIDAKYMHTFHSKISYDDIVMWSRKLYELREVNSTIIYLEPYLFYVMFNWPRKSTKHHITPNLLRQALFQWREAYYKKWPSQREGEKPYKKKDTTIYFLSYGSEMGSLVNYHELKGPEYRRSAIRGDAFWREPHVLRTLERFEGVLSRDGETVEIKLESSAGMKDNIDIATSFPIRDRSKWNKRVYFVIGFSWMGPRAFDISLDDPTASDSDMNFMVVDHKVDLQDKELKCEKHAPAFTHADIIKHLSQINLKLMEIHSIKLKETSGMKLQRFEIRLLAQEDRYKRERADVLWQRQKLIERMKEF